MKRKSLPALMLALLLWPLSAYATDSARVYFLTFRFMTTYVPETQESLVSSPFEKWTISSQQKQEHLLGILNTGAKAASFIDTALRGVAFIGGQSFLIDMAGVVKRDDGSLVRMDKEAFLKFGKSLSSAERIVLYDPHRSKK